MRSVVELGYDGRVRGDVMWGNTSAVCPIRSEWGVAGALN